MSQGCSCPQFLRGKKKKTGTAHSQATCVAYATTRSSFESVGCRHPVQPEVSCSQKLPEDEAWRLVQGQKLKG